MLRKLEIESPPHRKSQELAHQLFCSRHLNGTTDVKLSFGSKHLNTIEACQDEGHHEAAVQLIQDFVSSERKPPKAILKYLVKDVLLESKSKALTSSVYATLKHIQNLHPELESDVDLWNWNFLSGVVEKILHSPEKETEVYNNVLCLEYIISVLENNLEVYARFPQKSIISHYLAAEMQGHRLNSLVTWMIDCVKIKFSPETVSYESHSRSEHVARLLTLLQKLLEMSVVVTRNPSDSATKVAEEMVYQYLSLPSLKCRQLFLETMGSHLVRAKLLELLLENCCELDSSSYNEVRSPGHWAALSARKILEHHFKRKPVNNPFSACPNESDNSLQQVREAEACEELVMILYCLLQSHLRCVHGKLHLSLTLLYHDDSARSQSSQSSSQSSVDGSLASDDLQCLNEIHSHIVQLRDRLSTYCQNFTHKTKLLFHLMEVFKDFGQD
ncbi:SUMO-interacting motif-containing protein 1-like [Ptychodera flava]|uniref:SUMO-interacting motif-containing protein 1-like n=1 Tax=Ptychodera flava TaxID=63121 RepID=UPI003969BBC6